MKLSKIRKCYANDWTVEFYLDGAVTDLSFDCQGSADRFYHLLKMWKHAQKARG